jgi:cation:H+ antiporter
MLLDWVLAGSSIVLSCFMLMFACNTYEQVADFLGRKMGSGIKGMLILAPGSSAPEIMFLLLMVMTGKPEMIMAGIAVTAGSAIFNGCLIPASSILAAKNVDFKLDRKMLVSATVFLLLAELTLIYFIQQSHLTFVAAGTLIAIYVLFVIYYLKTNGGGDVDSYEYESLEYKGSNSKLVQFLRSDFNRLVFGDKPFTTMRAWLTLGLVILVLGVGCHILSVGLQDLAVLMGVPLYFTAVTFGAAATSLPDTILSIKEARKGGCDDAVANAIGSNVFDTTIAVGIPTLLALAAGASLPLDQSGDVNVLRWFIVGSTLAVSSILYIAADKVTKATAYKLLGVYAIWIGYLIYTL